jgi:hypothetical protein
VSQPTPRRVTGWTRYDGRWRGLAALSTVATSQTDRAVAAGTALPAALVDGFTTAFVAGVAVAASGSSWP